MRWTIVLLFGVAACGGQPAHTAAQSKALGDQSAGVPPATLHEHDWKKAATGHGAAGVMSADELAHQEKESAPGARLPADAGAR